MNYPLTQINQKFTSKINPELPPVSFFLGGGGKNDYLGIKKIFEGIHCRKLDRLR